MDIQPAAPCAPAECEDAIASAGFDPLEEESLLLAAHWLGRLGANRTFLADAMLAELAGQAVGEGDEVYGPQVIMLGRPRGNFFLRANIWPARGDHAFRASGGGSFVYGLPHDHNFDFLTHGYFGPGYESDYYEYDHAEIAGHCGEKVALKSCGRSRLEQGSVMHYRAHRDIHAQHPPASISVSINVMHMGPQQAWSDQYRFDPGRGTIEGVLNPSSAEAMLRIAVGMGSGDAHDLAASFGRHHVSHRMRLAAFDARAGSAADDTARDAIWREAELAGSLRVQKEAGRRRAALEQGMAASA
jgi:hypothetical protein